MHRTKIVATIGPASDSPDILARLLSAGMDVARLNFSHGAHAEHARRIALLRKLSQHTGRPLAIMQDLQGPKIRTGALTSHTAVALRAGDHFTITTNEFAGTAARVSTTYTALPGDVCPGDRILVSDGLIELRVLSTNGVDVKTEVVFGGELREHQGINLPGVNVSSPALTEKDTDDLAFGLAQDVDYVALSFVRRAADVIEVKRRIAAAGKDTPVIAKIEKPEALDDLSAILAVADAVMVARGDLGVEMAPEQVPIVQKQIIEACNDAGVPVITATQMLDSMTHNPRPTRAEASDVANAIIDGADAVMLSAETATGYFPVEAVRMMARIAEAAEASNRHGAHIVQPQQFLEQRVDVENAMSVAACAIVNTLPVKAIVAFTMRGATARLVSRLRPKTPIFAFTPSEAVFRRLSLIWGVTPIMCECVDRLDDLSMLVNMLLLTRGLACPGDTVVTTGGHPIASRGATNFVKVLRISE